MAHFGSKNLFSKIFSSLLDLIFPKKCLGCGKEGYFFCDQCFKNIEINLGKSCVVCGRQAELNNQVCAGCGKNFFFDQIFVMTAYDGSFKKLIGALKFDYIEDIAEKLAEFFIQSVDKADLGDNLKKNLLIPVPLHKKRFLERGFNQAELIAAQIAKALEMKLDNKSLKRVKNTKQQANLNKSERLENMKDAFAADFEILPEKVFLFDDVFTTGQTMNEAARALKQAGVKEVNVLALAHGN